MEVVASVAAAPVVALQEAVVEAAWAAGQLRADLPD